MKAGSEASTPRSDLAAQDADSPPGAQKSADHGIAGGVGCAALVLPVLAVCGAALCFAAGVLSTASGCVPNGSALCSANGPWFTFAFPLLVSPFAAVIAAVGAVTVRRHRSTWLAVGYAVVFVSIVVGLASASTGSS